MRLFVAIDVGAEVASEAGDLIGQLRVRARELAPRARITWVAPARLHLTVRFLGDVSPEVVPAVELALSAPLAISPFDVTFGGLDAFPPRGAPRALWVGVIAGLGALMDLEQQVSARLEQAGVTAEPHPYRPHLTLARVRDARGLCTADLVRDLSDTRLGSVPVTATTLIESHLLPAGPDYLSRRQTAFGGHDCSPPAS